MAWFFDNTHNAILPQSPLFPRERKMSDLLSDNVTIDDENGTITIYGVKYAGYLFEQLGLMPVATRFELVSREDGVLTIRNMSGSEELT
jgi:hypothetical protein